MRLKEGLLERGLQELGIDYDDEVIKRFGIYKEMLKEWNQKMNITAITDDDEIDIKHFLDSAAILKSSVIEKNHRAIDIGTGGGFPGLPVKILLPEIEMVLFDSLNKRLKFLNAVIDELGLENVETVHGRAEEFGRKEGYRESFDIVMSRAVASLNTLSEYCIPFVKKGGYFVAMKGPDLEDELKDAKNAIGILGGKIDTKKDVHIPFSDLDHNILTVKKVKNTPKKYPRGGGNPKKKPL